MYLSATKRQNTNLRGSAATEMKALNEPLVSCPMLTRSGRGIYYEQGNVALSSLLLTSPLSGLRTGFSRVAEGFPLAQPT